MNKIYICQKCNNLRSLYKCDTCDYIIPNNNEIYNFLDPNYISEFDTIGQSFYEEYNHKLIDEIARTIKTNFKVNLILDLGAGNGSLSKSLCKYNYSVISLDSSIVMLEQMYYKTNIPQPQNNQIILADAHKIPLANNIVDLVVVNNLFHLLDKPKIVLEEIYRVLRDGGMFIHISDFIESNYKEKGNKLIEYYQIKNNYFNIYWNELNKLNIHPKKYRTNFNLFLDSKSLFKYVGNLKTNPIYYKGEKHLMNFFNKLENQASYELAEVPKTIHNRTHNKVMEKLKNDFNDFDIKIFYEGVNINIIDIYEK